MARRFSSAPLSIRRYFIFLILVVITTTVSLIIYVLSEKVLSEERVDQKIIRNPQNKLFGDSLLLQKIAVHKNKNADHSVKGLQSGFLGKLGETVDNKRQNVEKETGSIDTVLKKKRIAETMAADNITLNYHVHLFYYPWYGNQKIDGKFIHWNHQYIPHWRKEEAKKWPTGVHIPPDDIGSNFYPALGPYSSADPSIMDKHMQQIQSSGAGVIVVSWYPPDQADENGQPIDKLIPLLLDSAHRHGVKVAIHIEPYKNRNGATLKQHIKYIMDSYGQHPGFYRQEVGGGKQLPVYYVYDSYQVDSSLWAQALKPGGQHCLRGTEYDGIFLGLYLGPEDEAKLLAAGFDGFYTYFAANGFTKGSSWSNWKRLATFASQNHLLFVPSVGPGYVDTRVRPWNGVTTRKRLQGKYFRESFQAALDAGATLISVTSFNEWHEGTQIEPAVPKTINGFKYEDYSPQTPDFYLQLVKEYVDKFSHLQ